MYHLKSSYQFHLRLEPPGAFLRREWKAIALFGGTFCILMIAAVLLVDPAFFYPRLETDPLNYYLKARSLVETGSTAARSAVNLPPFPYAAMPGVLRAPFIALSPEFDAQLRGMQLFNIPIVGCLALMSAYILSWTQPARRHWMVIAFAFAFTLLSPVWIANILLPLADAPYAAFSLGALVVAISIICGEKPISHRPGAIALFAVLFVVAFLLRFTGPAVIVFAALLARGRWIKGSLSLQTKLAVAGGTALFMLILVAFNANAIFGRYFFEPLAFLIKGDKPGMVLNLLAVALPSQVIPNFQLGFVHPPIVDFYRTTFASTPADAAWMVAGILISTVTIVGAWRARNTLLPEIMYVLVPLPVLALVLPSATRYMMSYQPFIWIFFYLGAAHLAKKYGVGSSTLAANRAIVAIAGIAVVAGVVGLRWWRFGGTASERALAVTATAAPRYVSDVSRTFRGLRSFLETLPPDRTLLIGDGGSVGRWKIIAGRNYYYPDIGLDSVVRTKDVYLLAECGTPGVCHSWSFFKGLLQDRLREFGEFQFDSVYAAQSGRARVEVFRVRSKG